MSNVCGFRARPYSLVHTLPLFKRPTPLLNRWRGSKVRGARHMRAAAECQGPAQTRHRREHRGPTQRAPGPGARHRECRGSTQRPPGPDRERQAPTRARERRVARQRPPGPAALSDSEKAGPRHRERRDPTQRAPGPDTKSAGPRHRNAGPRHRAPGHDIDLQVFPVKKSRSTCVALESSSIHMYIYICVCEQVERDQKASVNGSYHHGAAFASHSVCFMHH